MFSCEQVRLKKSNFISAMIFKLCYLKIYTFFSVSSVVRSMSGHGNNMKIEVSRWQWHKFKDLFHFYTMLGVIPATLIVFLTNIYIGPAKLAEIPEGYTPHHWEYHKVCRNLIFPWFVIRISLEFWNCCGSLFAKSLFSIDQLIDLSVLIYYCVIH